MVIVGAGIGGLAAGIALKELGLEVAVFEKRRQSEQTGAALTLWPNAAWALERLGVLEEALQDGNIIQETTLQTYSGKTLSCMNQLSRKYGYPTFSILRKDLHTVLQQKLGDSSVHYGKACTQLVETRDGIVAHLEDGSEVTGDLFLGADGLHSTIRSYVLGRDVLRNSGYIVWRGVCTFPQEEGEKGRMFEWWGKGTRFGFIPLKANQVYWFATQNATSVSTQGQPTLIDYLLSVFEKYPALVRNTIKSTRLEDILQNHCWDRKPVNTWKKGPVLLLGDAAHPMTPNLGQGACLALEDSVCLATILQEEANLERALSLFESRRIPRAKSIVQQSWRYGKIAQLENAAAIWIRNQLLPYTKKQTEKEWATILGYRC